METHDVELQALLENADALSTMVAERAPTIATLLDEGLADAAHQIRTPLASLRLQAEMAADDDDPESLRKSVHRIHRNAVEASQLTSQLLSHAMVIHPGWFDRSPCGTGTSAKLACLAADGKLAEGQVWRQEGILGSVFEGTYTATTRGISPRITGQAYLTARAQLLIEPGDSFAWGIRPADHPGDGHAG